MLLSRRVLDWLVCEWPGAALLVAAFLVALLPIWWSLAGSLLTLVFVQLVIYLIHQGEEHIGDRFRRFINQNLAGGRDALTPIATFWINSLLVWVIDLLSLALAVFVAPAYGLIAAYLAVINAIVHIAAAVRMRSYNPGLFTAIILFIPLGAWLIAITNADWSYHVLAAAIAIAGHAVIILHVRRRIAAIDAGAV